MWGYYMQKTIRTCAILSIIGSIFFLVSVLLLGFIQPGYNHIIDTISVLALGKYGWIQQINFIVLALGFGALGIGLGLHFYRKIGNPISVSFLLLSLCVFVILLFRADPVDRTQVKLVTLHSQEGFIHLSVTFIMIAIIPLFLIDLIKKLNRLKSTRSLALYTSFVMMTNIVFGLLWFYCRRNGIGFEIKGIWQKGLALNILIWMMVIGRWLYRREPARMKS